MAVDLGACFWMRAEVRSGQVVKWPRSMAWHQVAREREKRVSW